MCFVRFVCMIPAGSILASSQGFTCYYFSFNSMHLVVAVQELGYRWGASALRAMRNRCEWRHQSTKRRHGRREMLTTTQGWTTTKTTEANDFLDLELEHRCLALVCWDPSTSDCPEWVDNDVYICRCLCRLRRQRRLHRSHSSRRPETNVVSAMYKDTNVYLHEV